MLSELSNISPMPLSTVFVRYWVRPAVDEVFRRLVFRGWEILDRLELIEPGSTRLYHDTSERDGYVEVFTWVHGGSDAAHDHPDVVTIWEEMDLLLGSDADLPTREFSHFEQVQAER